MRQLLLFVPLLTASLNLAERCCSAPIVADFVLLQNQDSAGRKPSAPIPTSGDWLIGTDDDQILASSYNPAGAWSHNLADLTGTAGAGFNMAPSLSGSLSLELTPADTGSWSVSVASLQFVGQATPFMFMNQYLVTPEGDATQSAAFGVDGIGNSGTWRPGSANNWEIEYNLDFYFATNADGDVPIDPNDVDVTFDDKRQSGYLLPVSSLTPAGLSLLVLDDPAGYYAANFRDYLLNAVAPSLPHDATYVLVTQMSKTNPDFAELGLPITTTGLIGNTTIAYTTATLPEPASLGSLATAGGMLLLLARCRFFRDLT